MWTFVETLQRRSSEAGEQVTQMYTDNREQLAECFGQECDQRSVGFAFNRRRCKPDLQAVTMDACDLGSFCARLRVNLERVKHWQGKGAQLSSTAERLVKQFAKKAA